MLSDAQIDNRNRKDEVLHGLQTFFLAATEDKEMYTGCKLCRYYPLYTGAAQLKGERICFLLEFKRIVLPLQNQTKQKRHFIAQYKFHLLNKQYLLPGKYFFSFQSENFKILLAFPKSSNEWPLPSYQPLRPPQIIYPKYHIFC